MLANGRHSADRLRRPEPRALARVAVIGLRGLPGVIGGIESHCELLYPALAEAAPDLDVVLLVRRAYAPMPRFRLGSCTVRALPSLRGKGMEAASHTLLALLYARLRLGSTLVHIHGIGPALFTPLARLLRMRVVVTHHAADFQRRKWQGPGRLFLRLGEAMAARFADRVICVSEAVRRDFLSRYPGASTRTSSIRHAASVGDIEPQACEHVVRSLALEPGGYVLAVGRLEETKRFDDLIAAHAIAGSGTLPLVIVGASIGASGCEDALRAMAGTGVVFAGFRTGLELAACYRGAALFVHASEMEGFGLVVLEAIIAGLPVRLSDIPPHREFGLPDRCYFPVGDTEAIAAFLRTPPASSEETSDYPAIIARHSLGMAVRTHVDLFREILVEAGLMAPASASAVEPRRERSPESASHAPHRGSIE